MSMHGINDTQMIVHTTQSSGSPQLTASLRSTVHAAAVDAERRRR